MTRSPRVVPPVTGMSTYQQHPVDQVTILGKSGQKPADTVTDYHPFCPWESTSEPIEHCGTILASPFLNGRTKGTQ